MAKNTFAAEATFNQHNRNLYLFFFSQYNVIAVLATGVDLTMMSPLQGRIQRFFGDTIF